MTRPLAALLVLLSAGCGNQLTGTIDDVEVGKFADGVYFELRYVDEGITNHDLTVWPMEDSCSTFPALLDGLVDARAAIAEDSLEPQAYCTLWESVWEEHVGLDPFWMAQYSVRAQPRRADASVEAEYPWHDRDRVNDFPVFDADVARYPAPGFAACAEEFEGNALYEPTVHAATGGALELTGYVEDESLDGSVEMTLEGAGDEALSGTFQTTFCPAAQEWPLVFGLGL